MKIIDKKDRGVLGEGRNNGMGFAFLQKEKDTIFETVQPISPCKDYLAEVVFTEKYDIPTKAWGLFYEKKLNIFSDCAYMVIKMMQTRNKMYSYSKSFEDDVKLLEENYKNIERLINDFEKELKLNILTTITPVKDYFLVKFSSDWCQSTPSISLYSLLLRVLFVATEKDTNILDFLKSYSYHPGDKSLIDQNINKIELILKTGKLPPNTYPYSRSNLLKFMGSPHNNGIVSWNSSFEEVPLKD